MKKKMSKTAQISWGLIKRMESIKAGGKKKQQLCVEDTNSECIMFFVNLQQWFLEVPVALSIGPKCELYILSGHIIQNIKPNKMYI